MSIERVGVVGAGVMGVGLAQSLGEHGFEVVLLDLKDEILTTAQANIRRNVRMQGLLKKGDFVPADTILGKIQLTTDYADLGEVDFVIENIIEKWPAKESVYGLLNEVCPRDCVLAANTSAISITRIASLVENPQRVLGMHFMNPVPMKPVVEVIRAHHTSEETLATADTLLKGIGKEGIVVNDMPGFVSNRVLMLTVNEAIFLLQDQVATAEKIDRIFKTCFGHKMGPLETADLIGLDTILYSLEVLYESYNEDKFRPCPLLKKLVYAGLHGRKNGQGFYDYNLGGGATRE